MTHAPGKQKSGAKKFELDWPFPEHGPVPVEFEVTVLDQVLLGSGAFNADEDEGKGECNFHCWGACVWRNSNNSMDS